MSLARALGLALAFVVAAGGSAGGHPAAEIQEPKHPSASDEARAKGLVDALRDKGTRERAREELKSMGRGATPVLIRLVGDPDPNVRWELASILGSLRDDRALPALVARALQEEYPHLRAQWVWALGQHEDASAALPPFLEALRSLSEVTRWNAAIALSMLGRREALLMLHAEVQSLNSWRRWEAINALGRVHDPSTPYVLEAMIRSKDVRDRSEAVLVLGTMEGEKVVELLLSSLGGPRGAKPTA